MTTLLIGTAPHILAAALITFTAAMTLSAQSGSETTSQPAVNAGEANPANHDAQSEPAAKRIFGIVPNYRSSLSLGKYSPITPREKFAIARQDSFDRGTFILGALFLKSFHRS